MIVVRPTTEKNMATSVGLAIKNGILFVLIILIVHLALRRSMDPVTRGHDEEEGSHHVAAGAVAAVVSTDSSNTTSATQVVVSVDASGTEGEVAEGRRDIQLDPEMGEDQVLMKYVFGNNQNHVNSSSNVSLQQPQHPQKEMKQIQDSISSSGIGVGKTSYMVVGSYTDENELCGGRVLKSPNEESMLNGFGGFEGAQEFAPVM